VGEAEPVHSEILELWSTQIFAQYPSFGVDAGLEERFDDIYSAVIMIVEKLHKEPKDFGAKAWELDRSFLALP
jgi:hypothetical protein